MSEKSTIFKQHLFQKKSYEFLFNFHQRIFSLYSYKLIKVSSLYL